MNGAQELGLALLNRVREGGEAAKVEEFRMEGRQ